MAYDSLRGRTVLFGGDFGTQSPIQILGDTWEWDGNTWLQRTPASGPSPRSGHRMAYDSIRHRVVLFGGWQGDGNPLLGDTWEWDGTNWIPRISLQFPSARVGHAMCFDSQRGRTVLFGGQVSAVPFGDTWEWDGANWIQRSAGGPPPRSFHAMAFDSQRNRTVLFGGYDFFARPSYFGDTWEWDGTVWTQRAPVGSPPRMSGHTMTYDSLRSRVVLFLGQIDGTIGNPPPGDTWEWDGTNWWSYGMISSPPTRFAHAMAFHAQRGRSVVFGGVTPPGGISQVDLADTWEWGGPSQVATVQAFGTGCGQPALVAAAATGSRPLLGTTYQTDVTNIPGSVAFMAVGLSNTGLGAFSLPLPLDGFGLTGCWLYHDCVDLAEPCVALGSGAARHSIVVPNNNTLLGVVVFLQAWAPAPAANPAGVIVSNGLGLTVGNL